MRKLIKAINVLICSIWLILPTIVMAGSNWRATGSSNGDVPAKFSDIESIFSNILSVLIPFAGVAIFVMILIGGFKFLTSAGDPKATASAGQTITWAIIGLLFLIGAWLVLVFIKQITGIDVTLFEIPKNT